MIYFLTIGHTWGSMAGEDLFETEILDAHTRIQEIANAHFKGGLVFASGTGFWEGNREGATCVMVADAAYSAVQGFAQAIKLELLQDAVGCFKTESENTFL